MLSSAACLLAALVPTSSPAPFTVEPVPVFVSIFDYPAPEPAPPTLGQQVVMRSAQVVGGTGVGILVGLGGVIASLPPALVLSSMDSGDVAGGAFVLGGGIGYATGAALAICSAGKEIGGCEGSRLMTGLGVGAGLALAGGMLKTELLEGSNEAYVLLASVPSVTGILAYELSRTLPCVRKEVSEELIALGVVVAGSASFLAIHRYADRSPFEGGRVIVPLLGMRW